jgi:hypothetical protein
MIYNLSILKSIFPLPNLDISIVYLFGSKVLSINEGNDFDLLIVSNDFEGVSRLKRDEKIKSYFNDEIVDPICLTNKEFERLIFQKSEALAEILKNAMLIYGRENN